MKRFGIIKCQIHYYGRDPLWERYYISWGANVVYKHQSRAQRSSLEFQILMTCLFFCKMIIFKNVQPFDSHVAGSLCQPRLVGYTEAREDHQDNARQSWGRKGLGRANVHAYEQQGHVVKPQILVVTRFLWNTGYFHDRCI
ncbi:uncharacterized protein LOC122295998 isoform X2 [Carya illinoinensis]|uniref:uncharacterized protein LOC122295998 isoform X2 n=1 Tax=Carya illinoinensis TaxID=32201 RepID=UPI001C72768B|nr:uncharacterized protein LOC122295998 isoform X2 [Carya illinoinensis]